LIKKKEPESKNSEKNILSEFNLDFGKFWHPLPERGKLQGNEFSRKRVFTPS